VKDGIGGESRLKDRVTLRITLLSHFKFTLKIHPFSLDISFSGFGPVLFPFLILKGTLGFWVFSCFGKKECLLSF
jgi:hypothetical protein